MKITSFYHKRRQKQQAQFLKYSRYIFNDHLVLALFFLLGALAFQYQAWLKNLHGPQWIAESIVTLAILLFIYLPKPKTFIREADTVFMLPMEKQFSDWFRQSYWLSLIFPTLLGILGMGIIYPYYYTIYQLSISGLLLTSFSVWILMAVNLLLTYDGYHFQYSRMRVLKIGLYGMALLLINGFTVVSPIVKLSISIIYGLIAIVIIHSPFSNKKTIWAWNQMVSDEVNRQQANDKLLSLFVDVKTLTPKIKRRKYTDIFIQSFLDTTPYRYLLQRSFWRGPEYVVIWFRLLLLNLLLIWVLPNNLLSLIIVGIVSYFSHFQILPLFEQGTKHPLLQTAPIHSQQMVSEFMTFLIVPFVTQGILLVIFSGFVLSWAFAVKLGIIQIIVYFILYTVLKKRQHKKH